MRYRLLGPLKVERAGSPVGLGGPKQRLVLAHLLIRANKIVSTETLIDEIWGEDPPSAARASLQSYVSHLRAALGGDRLEGRPPGYLLRAAADEIDASRFEATLARARSVMDSDPSTAKPLLEEALELWQGEPIADLADEPSLQPEIERLSEMRRSALEDLMDVELALGRHQEQIPELKRLVSSYPLRERLHSQLMLALYRAGQQAEALAVYHHLRGTLDNELGVDPSPAVERLQHQILVQHRSLELAEHPLRGYRIIGKLGSGSLGTTHRGFEAQTERDVAIKVLSARVANDPDFVRTFDADARRVARIENPHIAPAHDWWREPDAAYLVMRLMTGGSLAGRLESGRLDVSAAVLWADQLGSALDAIHRHGLVHGNLHPNNVLLDDDGNAYLSDFVAGFDPASLGTAASNGHLAPERRRGGPPTPAADIYALASILGHLFTAWASDGETRQLSEVLRRATSPTPADRPVGARDLVGDVRAVLRGPTTQLTAAVDASPTRNPYKGLRAFEEADAADFAGREALVGKLVERMAAGGEAGRLLAVVGPSGSGKSSVVSAGLIPALRAGAVLGSDQWFVASMSPGARPFKRLERALRGIAIGSPPSQAELMDVQTGLQRAVDRLLPADAELLLLIDQFEELYTLADGDAQRFQELLARAVDDPESRVRIVITLRADFYDRPLRHERLGRQLASRTHVVPTLTPEELERAITEPALGAGLTLDDGLATRIVAEMSEHPGALPLLQFVLAELWERRDGRRLSLESYQKSGGISEAVARRAEQLVRQLRPGQREAARQVFLHLVEPGEGTQDTSRRVRRSELPAVGPDGESIDAVVDHFARYRLLVLDRDADTREPTVQLAHEALLRAWPRLQRWVDQARDDLRKRRELDVAARQWVEAGRHPSFLLAGLRLEQFRALAEEARVRLSDVQHQYLAASIAEQERLRAEEERRASHERALKRRAVTRLRALVLTFAIGALLAGGLGVFALAESNRAASAARAATARELAAAAVANVEVDPERAILLALEAIEATRAADGSVLPEAEEALHRAVVASRVVLSVPGVGGDIDWSPDGSMFVTEGVENSGMVDIRDPATGDSIRTWPGHDVDLNDVAFNHDGSMLATAGDDGTARVWDPDTGEELGGASGQPGTVESPSIARSPSFSADGRLVAAAWPDEDVVRILDIEAGRVRELGGLSGAEYPVFSPDGRRLAVGTAPNRIVILDVESGDELASVQLEFTSFRHSWSPDGRWFAASGRPVHIWDGASIGPEPRFAMAHNGAVDLAWSADSRLLLTGSEDGTATLWEVTETGPRELTVLSSHDHGRLWGVALSPDGDRAMTAEGLGGADRDPVVKVWDIGPNGDAEVANLPAVPGWTHVLHFTPEGNLAAASEGGTATVWDFGSRAPVVRVGPHGATGDPSGPLVIHLDISPDGELIATGGNDGTAIVWDAASGDELFTVQPALEPEIRWIEEVAWSRDGAHLAVAANSFPHESSHVLIVDRAGASVEILDKPGMRPERVGFSPDGQLVAVAWIDTQTFVLDAWHVGMWDRERAEWKRSIMTPARALAFDPSGTRLATVNDGGWAEIWDVSTGELLATLTGTTGDLSRSISFSPDGTRVVTAHSDGSVRLWDAESGEPQLVLRGHREVVARAAFNPDGDLLASTGADGVVRIWALDLDDLIEIARSRVTRTLTTGECRQYLHTERCPTD